MTSVLPTGGEDLKGDEVDKIINFKNSLGIEDPDAAAMHMEVPIFTCFFCLQRKMCSYFFMNKFQLYYPQLVV